MNIDLKKIAKKIFDKNIDDITSGDILQHIDSYPTSQNKYPFLEYPHATECNQSSDGKIKLFKSLDTSFDELKIYVLNEHTDSLLIKEYENSKGQSKGIFASCISSNGSFALVIETYYPDNPHRELELYLYNLSGTEKLHIFWTQEGYREFTFSNSSKYFFLTSNRQILIFNLIDDSINIFAAEDMENCSLNELFIDEESEIIGLHYTQHPDSPIYHFTFSGQLLEKDLFRAQIEKHESMSQTNNDKYFALLKEIDSLPHPITTEDYEKYSKIFLEYINQPDFKEYESWLYRYLGEFSLSYNDKPAALTYLQKALELNPSVGVKRIVNKLQKELS